MTHRFIILIGPDGAHDVQINASDVYASEVNAALDKAADKLGEKLRAAPRGAKLAPTPKPAPEVKPDTPEA